MPHQSLPPSITVSPIWVGVSVLTDEGVTVQVTLPRPRGLCELPADQVAVRARRLARAALLTAFKSLDHFTD